MSTNKPNPKKKTAKKAASAAPAKKKAATKASPAKKKGSAAKKQETPTAGERRKPGRPKKQAAKTTPSLKSNAKDGDGDGKVQDGTKFERVAGSRTSTNSAPSNVVVSASGFAPVTLPSNATTTTATGAVPPANVQAQIAKTALGSKKPEPKRGFFARLFRRNKKNSK